MAYRKHKKLRKLWGTMVGTNFLSKRVDKLLGLFSEAMYEVQKEDSSLLLQSSSVCNAKNLCPRLYIIH